jgi:hypothetical protein
MSFGGYVSPNQAFPTLGSQRLATNVVTPLANYPTRSTNTVVVTPPLTLTPNRSVETIREIDEIARSNNDANFYADKLIYHIHEYGDSNMLWPMIADLAPDMQELILSKVMWHFAVRGDVFKLLIPSIMYDKIPTAKREKHLKIVVHILKAMNRSDLIEHIKIKYGDFDL